MPVLSRAAPPRRDRRCWGCRTRPLEAERLDQLELVLDRRARHLDHAVLDGLLQSRVCSAAAGTQARSGRGAEAARGQRRSARNLGDERRDACEAINDCDSWCESHVRRVCRRIARRTCIIVAPRMRIATCRALSQCERAGRHVRWKRVPRAVLDCNHARSRRLPLLESEHRRCLA